MSRVLLAVLLLLNLLPARAAEPYRADAALVEAARKEGQVLWYTTLIVDQIVRHDRRLAAVAPGVDGLFEPYDRIVGQQVFKLRQFSLSGRLQ